MRYPATTAMTSPEHPDPDVFAGMATTCEDIEGLTRALARAVPADILSVELKRPR